MRKARAAMLAVAAILLAIGVGVAPAASGNGSSDPWEVGEGEIKAVTETSPGDSFEARAASSGRESDVPGSDVECWRHEDSEFDESEGVEHFADRCHGIVSCMFTLTGEVITLPFRILGGVFRFIF